VEVVANIFVCSSVKI